MKGGLGAMPLTLFVIVAAVILFLYLRRAHAGIDLHPGEKAAAPFRAPQPRVNVRPTVPPGAAYVPQGAGGVGVTQ